MIATRGAVRVANLSKRYGRERAVDNVDLEIEAGAFFVLLGGSGCGKTTLLRMIAGFVAPDEGTIAIDGTDIGVLPPHRRPVNMMFQSYALFAHMSVGDNVAFGLRREGLARREAAERSAAALAMVRMEGLAARSPASLSGGQRQRVALARALVKRPKVLLLDEPLSALDRQLREDTGLELGRLQRTLGTTFMMVTHDQQEAMGLATRIAVMQAGRVVQTGTPSEIYDRPVNRFVAGFLGAINLFEGTITQRCRGAIALDCTHAGSLITARGEVVATAAAIGVRPEAITIAPPGQGRLDATVLTVSYLGARHLAVLALPGGMTIRADLARPPDSARVSVDWPDDAAMILP